MSVLQLLRNFCIFSLTFVALLLGVTKLTSHGAQDAHELWVKQFENNYTPTLNSYVEKHLRLPLRISHEGLRLCVGTSEVACGVLLIIGSKAAARVMVLALVVLCAVIYINDAPNLEGVAFPGALLLMSVFIVLTAKRSKR